MKSFRFSLPLKYIVFTLESPHRDDAILMSTYNLPFFNMKEKNALNYPKSAAMGFFPKDSRTSSK